MSKELALMGSLDTWIKQARAFASRDPVRIKDLWGDMGNRAYRPCSNGKCGNQTCFLCTKSPQVAVAIDLATKMANDMAPLTSDVCKNDTEGIIALYNLVQCNFLYFMLSGYGTQSVPFDPKDIIDAAKSAVKLRKMCNSYFSLTGKGGKEELAKVGYLLDAGDAAAAAAAAEKKKKKKKRKVAE